MAEFISQKEIDALLNTVINSENAEKEDAKKGDGTGSPEPRNKFFKARKEEGLRYPTPYRSPVIKKENVVFDPEAGESEGNGKTVVRTLRNFLQTLKQNRKNLENISIDKR